MCGQAGDGGAAGVVGAEDLAQEDPQGDKRGKEPVQPAGDGGQRLGDEPLGEDVGERQVGVLKELAPQEVHLITQGSSVRGAPGGPPWR